MVKRTTLLDNPRLPDGAGTALPASVPALEPAPVAAQDAAPEWMLQSFKVEKKLFSNPPIMQGQIQFCNRELESFKVNLSPEQCRQIIAIIADTVKSAANDLAAKINATL